MATYDRRFPHMYPLDGRGIPTLAPLDRAKAEKIGRDIARRTQTVPFFNLITGGIFFSRGNTPSFGPYELPFVDAKTPEGHEIDNVVAYMNLALVPDEQKEMWRAGHEERKAHEKVEAQKKDVETRRHDIEDYAAHLSRARRGTQTTVQVL